MFFYPENSNLWLKFISSDTQKHRVTSSHCCIYICCHHFHPIFDVIQGFFQDLKGSVGFGI
jgi:hypothetical protein